MESALANRAKTEFLANMSHELRTPLNAIIGFADLIGNLNAQEMAAGKPRDYVSHISNAGKNLLAIVNDVLDISKIDAGKLALDIRLQAVVSVANAGIALAKPRFAAKKQVFSAHIAENLPDIPMDGARVKQVLVNLLSNASKFTPEQGKVFLIVTSGDNDTVTFAVSDTGKGMTPDEISYALRPFAQVQSSYAREQEGVGLGLTLARALVLQHKGQFHISSEPGAGTTIVFTLPVRMHNGAQVYGNGESQIERRAV
jgi:two-component system cell cycle sensor histidine kinase PleC